MQSHAPIPPPKLLPDSEFRRLADFLARIDYSQATLGARIGVDGPLDYDAVRSLPPRTGKAGDALEVMLRLFVQGAQVSGLDIKEHLPAEITELLEAFGLLARLPSQPGKWASQAMLYPLHDIWIASDRWSAPDGGTYQSFADIVYPGNANNTIEFLNWIPGDRCEAFLELCAGTGVLALLAAKHFAARAWATDIAPRSVHFSEFNRRLNGLENVVVLQGDLFDPVRGLQFDRIVAHPPYMPSLKRAEVYYDGGPDGELITSTAIREAGAFLKPGGKLFLQTLGTDRKSASFEERTMSWMGSATGRFHLAIIARRMIEPGRFAASSALRDGGGAALADQWNRFFKKAEITRLIYGLVILQAADPGASPFALQRLVGQESRLAEVEWLLRWEAHCATPGGKTALMSEHPVTSPRVEMQVTHRMQEGEFQPSGARLSTDYPFSLECEVPPWTGFLLAMADGSRTFAELFEECKQRRLLRAETPAEEFARYAASLVSGGFLELERWPLPKPAVVK